MGEPHRGLVLYNPCIYLGAFMNVGVMQLLVLAFDRLEHRDWIGGKPACLHLSKRCSLLFYVESRPGFLSVLYLGT
jgi:hypothetical protein